MPINPIQFPQYQINSQMDFTPLAKLGEQYRAQQIQSAKREALSQLGSDPTTNARVMMQAAAATGDESLAQAGLRIQQQLRTEGREDEQQAENTRRWEAGQKIVQSQEGRAGAAEARAVAEAARKEAEFKQKIMTPEERIKLREPAADRLGLTGAARDYYLGSGEVVAPPTEETGKQVSYGVRENPDGSQSAVPMVVKGGKLVEAPVPEGVTKVGPGAAELNKAAGKNQATAQTALPKMIASEAETNDIVGGMLGHPQQGYAVGYGGLTPSLPNVNSDYLSRIERLKGMTFLNAVPELKGFGALSNSEGDKLSAAKSRAADRRLTPEDHTEALLEVQHYQRLATERIKQMAQGRFNANNPDEYNRNILEGQAPTQYQIYQKAKKALKEGADPADVRALITKWGYDPGKWRM